MALLRTNADKRQAVLEKFQDLLAEYGSIDRLTKEWSDRAIAKHCGVSHRMVNAIHAELSGKDGKISQVQRLKAELETEREKNGQLVTECERLKAELALVRSTQVGPPQPERDSRLEQAIAYLSNEYDLNLGKGSAKFALHGGKELAELVSSQGFTKKDARNALQVAKHYQKLLSEAGITIPVWREIAEQYPGEDPEVWRIQLSGQQIRLVNPMDKAVLAICRDFKARYGYERMCYEGEDSNKPQGWYACLEIAEELMSALQDFGYQIDPTIAPAIEEYKRNPPPPPPPPYRIELAGEEIRLVYPYSDKQRIHPIVKSVELSPNWEDGTKRLPKGWYVPITKAEQLIEVLNPFEFAIDPAISSAIANWKTEQRWREEEIARTTLDLVAAADLDEPLPNGWTLFTHQREGVQWLLAHRQGGVYPGGILADQMGLGKSLQALVAAKAMQRVTGCHIFVVAPPILLEKPWLQEAESVGVKVEVFSDYYSSIPYPLENAKYLVIADEAHRYQSLTSKRTKALMRLVKHQNCLGTWLITGTPMANGFPGNLFPLLEICEHPLAANRWEYECRYCQAQEIFVGKKTVWKADGAANLDELAQKIDDVRLRRTKKDCLDLPPKIRILQPIELSEKSRKIYALVLEELRQSYRDRLKAKLISAVGGALARITQLRHAASLAKVEAAVSLAKEVLQEGDQIVLFSEFKDTAGKIYEALIGLGFSVELLTGETPKEERQPMIDRFQNGKTKAIVGTSATGGLGITLTNASVLVLVDRSWVPGINDQTEDRLHRIGQEQTVICIWLQYGFIDSIIDRLLDKKTQCIEYVLAGERRTLASTLDKSSELARELLEAMFGLESGQHPDDEN